MYKSNSVIQFYYNGKYVTEDDGMGNRPQSQYYVYTSVLSGVVKFDLYIDGKKVDTISVDIDKFDSN